MTAGTHILCDKKYSFILNLVPIITDMVAILNLKQLPLWKSLNWHNSKYIDEGSTDMGTNKLYDSILHVGNI